MSEFLYQLTTFWFQNFWSRWALVVLGLLLIFVLGSHFFVARKRRKLIDDAWRKRLDLIGLKNNSSTFNSFLKESGLLYRLFLQTRWEISWRSFQWRMILGIGLGAFIGLLVGGVFLGFVLGLLLYGFLYGFLWTKAQDQKKRMVEQLPIFLQAMSHTLQAGYSLTHSFAFVADEMDEPLRWYISQINRKLLLQVPLSEVLMEFADQVNHPEIDFFTESTIIQVQTGGNLVTLFKKIAFLVEEKLKLQRDIKSFTSQGKMSGVLIAALWPVSLLVFYWLSPSHVGVLFNTSIGNFMLAVSVVLELIGFFLIWRIIQIQL